MWMGATQSAFFSPPNSSFRKCQGSKIVKLVNGCVKSLNSSKMFKGHFPMLIWPLKHLISVFKKLHNAWFTWISVWEEDQRKSFCIWKRKKRTNSTVWKWLPLKDVLHLPLFEINYILLKVLPTGMIFLTHELFLSVYVTPPNIFHIAKKIVVKVTFLCWCLKAFWFFIVRII